MSTFKIKKAYLVGLGSWLNEQQLTGKQSRERTKFVSDVIEAQKEVEKDRVEMLERYAEKDESGAVKKETVDNQEHVKVDPTKIEELQKEYTEFMNENWIVDVTEANKEKMATIKDIVLNTSYRFGPGENDNEQEKLGKIRQMNDYPIWCQAFEGME